MPDRPILAKSGKRSATEALEECWKKPKWFARGKFKYPVRTIALVVLRPTKPRFMLSRELLGNCNHLPQPTPTARLS